jgi:hypothetical protein
MLSEPVIVTEYGVRLTGSPQNVLDEEGFRIETDADTISMSEHDGCIGFVTRRRGTETHDKLRCSGCEFVMFVPREVRTYGELRMHFREFNFPEEPFWLECVLLSLLEFVRRARARSKKLRSRLIPEVEKVPRLEPLRGRPSLALFSQDPEIQESL